jgi:signal peptidase II
VRELQTAGGTALTGNKIATGRSGTMSSADVPSRRRRRRIVVLLSVAAAVLTTDIITKVVVVATLSPPRAPVRLLGGLLTLRVTRNPGAAFSIGGPSVTAVFALIAVGVIVFILRTSRRIQSVAWAVTLGLLLGGATGNLIDRLLRAPGPLRGYVVDWIQLPHWPVFNVADSCIVCGGILAVFLAVRGVRIDGTVADLPRGAGSRNQADQRGTGDAEGSAGSQDTPGGGERPQGSADGDHGSSRA